MKYKHIYLALFFLVINLSCKMNNEKVVSYQVDLFFKKTSWISFNNKTLKENKLEHFIADKIDFFHRESFFSFMVNSKYKNSYDEFYLIEIEKPNGERAESKKILMISLNNEIKPLAFKKSINKWEEVSLSSNELKIYQFDNLHKSFRSNNNEYVLITKIDKYKF